MAMKTVICWSFIVLNNFFANMCVKENCPSPTKSLTALHCNDNSRTKKQSFKNASEKNLLRYYMTCVWRYSPMEAFTRTSF